MALEVFNDFREEDSMKERCKSYIFYHVILKMSDGSEIDGIIENVDGDTITILVGEDVVINSNVNTMSRQPPMGNRFRQYRPRNYPINRVGNIGLLGYPYIGPVPPYPYPYYPIYPIYPI